MSWYDTIEHEVDSCYVETKDGLLGKKSVARLIVYPTRMEVSAYPVYDGVIQKDSDIFYLDYADIRDVYESEINGKKGIVIKYSEGAIVTGEKDKVVIALEFPDRAKWVDLIKSFKKKIVEKKRKAEEEKRAKELQAKQLTEKREQDALDFCTRCYRFHVSDNTPYYELFREANKMALIYIGKDKSLNFLKIDGYTQEESNGVISFEDIHYYEKAGEIHYVTDIRGSYSNYGGSITGGNISKLAAAGGGLLFGMLGMAAGALLTYKPAEIKSGGTQFDINSDVKEVDSRSVILNFYSETQKQYLDIELPADIYNFLQTHLPEKKYNIVLELEKKAAVHQASKQIESGEVLRITSDNTAKDNEEDQMKAFKLMVDKLKMVRDADLLTEDEFLMEKSKLFWSQEEEMIFFKLKVDKLKIMRDADLLTEDEFMELKKKLLKML